MRKKNKKIKNLIPWTILPFLSFMYMVTQEIEK